MLESAQSKLSRAYFHLHQLKESVGAYSDLEPYDVSHQFDPKTARQKWSIRRTDEAPTETWSLMAGDCVHNARSALDHMVWELAGSDTQDTASSFPIFRDFGRFRSDAGRSLARLKRTNRRAWAFVVWQQPYHRPDPDVDLLWILNSLDTADKHKLLVATAEILHGAELASTAQNYSLIQSWLTFSAGGFEDDAAVLEGFVVVTPLGGAPYAPDDLKPKFTLDVAIRDPLSTLLFMPGTNGLDEILGRVASVLLDAERLLAMHG